MLAANTWLAVWVVYRGEGGKRGKRKTAKIEKTWANRSFWGK